MSPKFEIDVQQGQVEAFRTMTTSFSGAKIVFDEAAVNAQKATIEAERDQLLDKTAAALFAPKDRETEEKIAQNYLELLPKIFPYELANLHPITNHEQLDANLRQFHALCARLNDPRKEIVLIERNGLIDGKKKTYDQIAQMIDIASTYIQQMNYRAVTDLRHLVEQEISTAIHYKLHPTDKVTVFFDEDIFPSSTI